MASFVQVLAADGLGGFYRGIQLKVPETFLWNGTFYYCFTKIKPLFDRAFGTSGRKAGFAQSMAHGIVSGMLTQLCMFPFVVVNTRVTTYGENDGPKKSENIGWLERYARVCRQVYREGGLAAFWKGILAGLILTINPGIVATLKLRLSALAAGLEGRTSARQNFWIGFFSKLLASTITYPLVVCRTQMVVDQGSDGAIGLLDRFELMRATFARVVAEAGGISGLYAGVAPHLGQAALKEAIANTIRLKMYALAFNILSAKK